MKRVVVVVVLDVEGAVEAPAMTLTDPAWAKSGSGEVGRSFPSAHSPLALAQYIFHQHQLRAIEFAALLIHL